MIEWLPEQYLAEIGDSQGLAKAIQSALKPEAQDDFTPLYAKAKAELTVPAMAEQTLNIYKSLLKT